MVLNSLVLLQFFDRFTGISAASVRKLSEHEHSRRSLSDAVEGHALFANSLLNSDKLNSLAVSHLRVSGLTVWGVVVHLRELN